MLKKERGGTIEEGREEGGGTGSLSEGLAKDSRKRQVRKGTARTSEGNWHQGPGGHAEKKWTRLHVSKRCHWNLGVVPTASRLSQEECVTRTISSKGTGAGELKMVGLGLASVVSDLRTD